MAIKYPAGIDDNSSLPLLTDKVSQIDANSVNRLRNAIIEIEEELGIKPSSIYGSVKNRLDLLETISSTGAFVPGGDLSGSSTNQKVIGIQGNSIFSEVLGVSQDGYVLTWSNSDGYYKASPAAIGFTAGGDLSGTATNQTVIKIQNKAISSTAPTDGQILQFVSGLNEWKPSELINKKLFVSVGPSGSVANYICDGISDEIEINNAITYANLNNINIVKLLSGTYVIKSSILMKSNIQLIGNGNVKIIADLDFDYTNNVAVILSAGTDTTGTAITLSNNLNDGYNYIQVNSSSEYSLVNKDDYLMLLSDALWETISDTSGRKVGEFVKVSDLYLNYFTIYGLSRGKYNVSDNASLYRISFIENIVIENIEITQLSPTHTISNAGNCILLSKTINATVKNCRLHDWDGAGVGIHHSIKIFINNNDIYNLTDSPPGAYYGYGSLAGGCSEQIVIDGNTFDRVRHGFTSGPPRVGTTAGVASGYGVVRNIVVSNNTVTHATNSALDTHAQSDGILISGNIISACDTWGIYTRGRGTHISGNCIEMSGCGISVGSNPDVSGGSGSGTMVVGNTIRHMKTASSITLNGTIIGTGVGIQLIHTDNVIVSGNTIEATDIQGIFLGLHANNCVVENNTIVNANIDNSSTVGAITLANALHSTFSSLTSFDGTKITLSYVGTSINSSIYYPQYIWVSGAADPNNNGRFQISNIVSNSSLEYTNPLGSAPDANNGFITFSIEGATDNIILNNTAINTAISNYDFDVTGHCKYLIYDPSISIGGNVRNIIKNNTGINMETGLLNQQVSGSFYTGNSSTEATPIKVLTLDPDDGYFYNTPEVGTTYYNSLNNKLFIRTPSNNVWKRLDFGNTDQWAYNVLTVKLNQEDTSSATGRDLTVQAQNAATNGGNLILSVGTGASVNGSKTINLNEGSSSAIRFQINPSASSTMSIQPGVRSFAIQHNNTSTDNGATLSLTAQSTTGDTFNGGSLSITSGSQNTIGGATTGNGGNITITSGSTNASVSGNAGNISITAGSLTGTSSGNAGSITLTAGTSANSFGGSVNISANAGLNSAPSTYNGSINFRIGSTTFCTFLRPVPTGSVDMNWVSTITAPRIIQATTSTTDGYTFTINAQNSTKALSVGGDLALTSGSGTSAAGKVRLQSNSTDVAIVDDSKFDQKLGQRVAVLEVSSNHNISASEFHIAATTGGLTITLPASPTNGDTYEVSAQYTGADLSPTVISGNGHNITGSANHSINGDYESRTLRYSSTSGIWLIV